MIVQLTGTLVGKEPDRCVIDVGGVGYGVRLSLTTFGRLPEVGEEARLQIHTHVREDQLDLYGFADGEEKGLFQKLIAISGVGPRMALAILSGLPSDELVAAIGGGNRERLTRIPGVGKKTAERIIIELKDRLAAAPQRGPLATAIAAGTDSRVEEALSALTNLGYQRAAAESALARINDPAERPLEELIRSALRELCTL